MSGLPVDDAIQIEDGIPVWVVRVVNARRFRGVQGVIKARVVKMREGAVLLTNLDLYDIPDQPYFIHRVLDLGEATCAAWARALARERSMIVEVHCKGTGGEHRLTAWLNGPLDLADVKIAAEHCGRLPDQKVLAVDRAVDGIADLQKQRKSIAHSWDELAAKLERGK